MTRVSIEVDKKDNYIMSVFSALKKQMESDLSCEKLVSSVEWGEFSPDYKILEGLLKCDDIRNRVKIGALFDNTIAVEYYIYKESFKYIVNVMSKCNSDIETIMRHLTLELGNVVSNRCNDLSLDFNCVVSLVPEVDNKGHIYDKKYVYNVNNNAGVMTFNNKHNDFYKYITELYYSEEEE